MSSCTLVGFSSFVPLKCHRFTRYEPTAGGQLNDRHGGSGTSGSRSFPPELQTPAEGPWTFQ